MKNGENHIINCLEEDAENDIMAIRLEHGGSYQVGDPMATATFTVAQLIELGIAGIYEVIA